MRTIPSVKAYMTPFPHAIDVEAPLAEARQAMRRWDVRHLPVKRGDRLVGVVTDRDLKLALGPYVDGASDTDIRVRHACVLSAYTVDLATPVDQVVATMVQERIGSALVTKDGRLAGIFTLIDAARCLLGLLRPDPGPGDQAA